MTTLPEPGLTANPTNSLTSRSEANQKSNRYYVTAFYHFFNPEDRGKSLEQVKEDLSNLALELEIQGLVILGPEGINSTSAANSATALEQYKQKILQYFALPGMNFKDSVAQSAPFRKFVIKIRDEIVTTGVPELRPPPGQNHHLSPAEWNQVLENEKDVVMIDTRNWYEYKIGSFEGAINPNIEKFTEFPHYLESQKIDKNKKMLIFCTGGIRCEKGILELQRQGYNNVYQLEGGILKYLEEFPNSKFQGECFVFDHRVALDQNLKPSETYGLCPHCGQPAKQLITCKRCDHQTQICEPCLELEWKKDTCSKNCAYQYKLHPDRKAPHQWLPFELKSKTTK